MLGSTNAESESGNTSGSDLRYGERRECELCGEVRRCFDKFDVVACRACHRDFLPTSGLL